MSNKKRTGFSHRAGRNLLTMTLAVALLSGCVKSHFHENDLKDFDQVNLVANKKDKYHAVTEDQTLINGFGLAWSPNGTAWVNSVGGHVSELYTAEGGIVRPGVKIPSPTELTGGLPTGIVFSGGKGFKLENGNAAFLFTGVDGVLSGWNGGDNATRLRNPAGAGYTGLAIGSNNGRNLIYGANFVGKKIDVWDTNFVKVNMPFVDPQIPGEYSPYNIQAVGDVLFVVYARLGAAGPDVPAPGTGFVSVFNMDGTFVKRFASRGTLNVPWGVTMAPASFLKDNDMGNGGHGNLENSHGNQQEPVILVGNFGDGRINVFNVDGKYLGQLQSKRHTIVIDGLWALSFAPSTSSVDQSRLYFTAGPEHETDGLFGYLIKK